MKSNESSLSSGPSSPSSSNTSPSKDSIRSTSSIPRQSFDLLRQAFENTELAQKKKSSLDTSLSSQISDVKGETAFIIGEAEEDSARYARISMFIPRSQSVAALLAGAEYVAMNSPYADHEYDEVKDTTAAEQMTKKAFVSSSSAHPHLSSFFAGRELDPILTATLDVHKGAASELLKKYKEKLLILPKGTQPDNVSVKEGQIILISSDEKKDRQDYILILPEKDKDEFARTLTKILQTMQKQKNADYTYAIKREKKEKRATHSFPLENNEALSIAKKDITKLIEKKGFEVFTVSTEAETDNPVNYKTTYLSSKQVLFVAGEEKDLVLANDRNAKEIAKIIGPRTSFKESKIGSERLTKDQLTAGMY